MGVGFGRIEEWVDEYGGYEHSEDCGCDRPVREQGRDLGIERFQRGHGWIVLLWLGEHRSCGRRCFSNVRRRRSSELSAVLSLPVAVGHGELLPAELFPASFLYRPPPPPFFLRPTSLPTTWRITKFIQEAITLSSCHRDHTLDGKKYKIDVQTCLLTLDVYHSSKRYGAFPKSSIAPFWHRSLLLCPICDVLIPQTLYDSVAGAFYSKPTFCLVLLPCWV